MRDAERNNYALRITLKNVGKLFGTDGIRGVANEFPMTPAMMVKIGKIMGELLPQNSNGVIIGRDSRLSGEMLECALTAGLVASGIHVRLAGVIPTPAVAFLTKQSGAQAGIVISASHNPAKDNGVKIFSHDGFKIPDALEEQIEKAVFSEYSYQKRPIGEAIGRIERGSEAGEHYAEHALKTVFSENIPDFGGIKIVVDCANGAASYIGPATLKRLHADVVELCSSPDGLNINVNCGAVHTEMLQERVVDEQAQIGIAFDGDADRLILVDEHGNKVDGDQILAMLALDLFRQNRLHNKTLVATVMSNLGLEAAMEEAGVTLLRSAVGDRAVVQKMRGSGSNLGGEQSGHIVMFDHGTTGDGLVTALAVLKLLQAAGKPLSELAAGMKHFPQTLVNIPITTRKELAEMPDVTRAIRTAEEKLGKRGRVLVRYSGTELLARVMVEAEDEQTVARIAEMIAAEIRKEIGTA